MKQNDKQNNRQNNGRNIKSRFNNRNTYMTIAIIAAAAALSFFAIALHRCSRQISMQRDIADELIRFHVRANSDSEFDQKLKLEVRDAVVAYLEPLLAGSDSVETSRRIIEANEFGITVTARNVIASKGLDYDVRAYFENAHFPTRTYGDITLPAGMYDAYRIDIGVAKGRNWWCVLYPPLCFEDATHAVLSDEARDTLKETLTEEEYRMITETHAGEASSDIKVQFRLFKFLNKYI